MYSVEEVARTIDHAALKPEMTVDEVVAACEVGKRFKTASVCVRPCDVSIAAKELAGASTVVCTVIGFPHGSLHSRAKAAEAEQALRDGAVELDMVVNIGRLRSGEDAYVQKDIEAVVEAARAGKAMVKVILETCYLSDEQIVRGCELARAAGADFVKTSTGFGSGGATPHAIQLMMDTVGETMGVKASGGIRTFEQAVEYLKQGCRRLGIGSTERLLAGAAAEGTY